ncbi:MAG: hypothetical protein L7V86_10915 [Verrucomicrobiales bacterium]|nr:hypothetical protein [Verrucomicrobiales bacterium]
MTLSRDYPLMGLNSITSKARKSASVSLHANALSSALACLLAILSSPVTTTLLAHTITLDLTSFISGRLPVI